jgi:para-nitrobenzyl esterase
MTYRRVTGLGLVLRLGMPMPRSCLVLLLPLAAVVVFLDVGPAIHAAGCDVPEGPDVVCTEEGAVRGVVEGKTTAFKGIPYAKPPVGSLRWRPPQGGVQWEGIRDGDKFGPICPQIIAGKVAGSEDCLTLNVWRSREPRTTLVPVMVWVTGGGNHSLSGQGSPQFGGVSYDGETLVERGGVVYVSYNLRLGVLGFLAHPSLDAERPERVSGNYGSLDQVAMLRWLRRNIDRFGGDPNRVFLFGTSAGGGNICALMTSPLSRGLFHRASMQSSVPIGCEMQTLADAEKGTGAKVASAAGCDTAADIATCLRGKSTDEIVAAVPGTFGVFPRVYGPNVDGHVFPDQALKLIAARKHDAMPVIIGNTSEETMQFVNAAGPVTDEASYAAAIEKVFGARARDAILARYPSKAYAMPRQAFVALTTDSLFTCQSRRVARTLTRSQTEPVYRYIFARALENDPVEKANGAVHTVEHPFFFGWRGKYRPSEADLVVQQRMIGYWTRMARTGNPNGGTDPNWPAYSPANEGYLEIGSLIATKSGPTSAQCDFWDSVTLPWPHL